MATLHRPNQELFAELEAALDLVELATEELGRTPNASTEVRLELRKSRRLARTAVELLLAEALDR